MKFFYVSLFLVAHSCIHNETHPSSIYTHMHWTSSLRLVTCNPILSWKLTDFFLFTYVWQLHLSSFTWEIAGYWVAALVLLSLWYPEKSKGLSWFVFFSVLSYCNIWSHCSRLDVSESGLAALVRLCNGDMRKALNILQVFKYSTLFLCTLWLLSRGCYWWDGITNIQ